MTSITGFTTCCNLKGATLNVDNRNKDEDAGDEVTKPSEFGVFFQV
jgi:hypothetical protein